MKPGLLLLVLPMLGGTCDGKVEVTYVNQQFMWVRSRSIETDSVTVIRGTIVGDTVMDGNILYCVKSSCESYANWPETYSCLNSRISLALTENSTYDIYGWSEPADSRNPSSDRFMTTYHENWVCCD